LATEIIAVVSVVVLLPIVNAPVFESVTVGEVVVLPTHLIDVVSTTRFVPKVIVF
jgi:hypothetical protein